MKRLRLLGWWVRGGGVNKSLEVVFVFLGRVFIYLCYIIWVFVNNVGDF